MSLVNGQRGVHICLNKHKSTMATVFKRFIKKFLKLNETNHGLLPCYTTYLSNILLFLAYRDVCLSDK